MVAELNGDFLNRAFLFQSMPGFRKKFRKFFMSLAMSLLEGTCVEDILSGLDEGTSY